MLCSRTSGFSLRAKTIRRKDTRIIRARAASVEYYDVVEYLEGSNATQLRVGLVQKVDAGCVALSPLVEEEEGVWVPDERVTEHCVPVGSVLRVLDHAFGQRQDKEHNPHGEHAHDVWMLLTPVSPGVYRGE